MEGGMTYGRNTLVRSVNTRVPDDVKEKTIQELISESYAGVRLEGEVRHVLSTLQRVPKLIKTKKGESDLRWCIEALRGYLKDYKETAANMSIGSALEVTVLPRSEIKAEQSTAQDEPAGKEKILQELGEFADALDALGEVVFYGSGHKTDNTQEIRGIGLLLTVLAKQLHGQINELEEAA